MLTGDVPGGITGFQQLGYLVLLLYIFLAYSRVFDVKFGSLHIPGIAYRIILVMMLLSRGFLPALKHPIGKSMYFFTFWFMAAIPTSVWRGGSWSTLTQSWIVSFVMFLAVSGLLGNFQQVRKATYTLAVALFVLTLIAVFWGSTEETGRLFLPNGKFSNPNEMAQALLLGVPLWWLVHEESKNIGRKVVAAGIMFLMVVMISKCGSRGAMITAMAVVLTVFLRATIMGKMKLLVGGTVLIAIILGMMPGKLLRRYKTLSSDDDDSGTVSFTIGQDDYDAALEGSAVTSTQHRRDLLKKSIKFTFQHPLFGVGPGMFTVAEDADAKANGRVKGSWQGTHNSYTQVSSEIGIPALLAYVLVIFYSYRRTYRVHLRTKDDPRLASIGNVGLALNYCIIVYAVSVFFDYIAYSQMLSCFAGLAMALDITAQAEIDRRLAISPGSEPIPFTQFKPNWRRPVGAPQEA